MKKLLLLFFIPLLALPSYGTHLAGGTIRIICLGGNQWSIQVIKYRDPSGIPMSSGTLTIPGVGSYTPGLVSSNTNLPQPNTNPCLVPPPNSSLEEYVYGAPSVTLSPGRTYSIYLSQTARNSTNSIPSQPPMVLYAQIPDPATYGCNNSPVFEENPPMAVCLNEPLNYDGSAIDPEGDVLEYRLCAALTGNPPPPFASAPYAGGYSSSYPVSSSPPLAIDKHTGLVTGTPNLVGFFSGRWTFNYCVDEFRNGVKIGQYNREVQMTVTNCIPVLANMGTDYTSIALGMDVIASCDDYEVTFNNTSNGGSTFFWDFGVPGIDTDTSSQFEPTYTYSDTGTYQVKLIVNGNLTCADSIMKTVIVYPAASADFSSNAPVCEDTPMSFMDQSTMAYGSPIYWSWQFGDGDSSSQQHPSHTYTIPGNYLAQLMFESSKGCRDTVAKIVQVGTKPQVGGGGNRIICYGGSTILNGFATPGTTVRWSPSTGLSDTTITNPTASPDTSTTYTVTATNAFGCTNQATVLVTVIQPPTVSAGSDKFLCGSTNTQLSGSVTSTIEPYIVSWSPDSSLNCINCLNPTASPTETTTYVMTVTTLSGCLIKDSVTVEVGPFIVDLGADTSICGIQHVLNIGNPPGNILWSTGAQIPQITVMNSGTYSVTVSDGTCTVSDSVEVTLHPTPVLSLGPDIDLCQGDSVQLSGNLPGNYFWSTGATTDSITVKQGGFYSATITDSHGCADEDTVHVQILPWPTGVPNLGPDRTICDSVQLSAVGGVSYEWQDGSTAPTYDVMASGIYSITVTDTIGCQGSDAVNITVNKSPDAIFSFDTTGCPTVSFSNFSSGTSPLYSWDFGDGAGSSTGLNPSYTFGSNGLYVVELTASNLCDTNSVSDTVGIGCYPDGIVNPKGGVWRIYPNPASTVLYLEHLQSTNHETEISIINAIGQQVLQKRLNGAIVGLNIQHLPAGMYVLELLHNGEKQVLPVSIIR